MVKLHAFLLALTFATSSVIALPVFRPAARGLEEPFERDIIKELSRREYLLDARDSFVTLEARQPTSQPGPTSKRAKRQGGFFEGVSLPVESGSQASISGAQHPSQPGSSHSAVPHEESVKPSSHDGKDPTSHVQHPSQSGSSPPPVHHTDEANNLHSTSLTDPREPHGPPAKTNTDPLSVPHQDSVKHFVSHSLPSGKQVGHKVGPYFPQHPSQSGSSHPAVHHTDPQPPSHHGSSEANNLRTPRRPPARSNTAPLERARPMGPRQQRPVDKSGSTTPTHGEYHAM